MSGWIKYEKYPWAEAPLALKPVWIAWVNENGRRLIGRGQLVPAFTLEANYYYESGDWLDDAVDYHNSAREYYLKAGWYEDTGSGEFFNYLGDTVTHWQPIEYPE